MVERGRDRIVFTRSYDVDVSGWSHGEREIRYILSLTKVIGGRYTVIIIVRYSIV